MSMQIRSAEFHAEKASAKTYTPLWEYFPDFVQLKCSVLHIPRD